MGYILEPTPEMGEYRVEVRRESFYLHSVDDLNHPVFLYPSLLNKRVGTVEMNLEDIGKVRACLDQIELYCKNR